MSKYKVNNKLFDNKKEALEYQNTIQLYNQSIMGDATKKQIDDRVGVID